MILLKSNLSQELIFSLVNGEDREHIVFARRYKSALCTSDCCDLAGMCFQNESEVLLLVPDVNATVGASRVTDTVFIKCSTVEFGLIEFRPKCSILE